MPRPLVLIAACFIAAFAYGISGSVAFTLASLAIGGLNPDADIALGLILYTIILCLYGLAAAVVFGLPTHALMMRLRQTNLMAYAAGGLIPGMLVAVFWVAFPDQGVGVAERLLLAGLSLTIGAIGGVAFWLVARPDRHAASRAIPA